MAKAISKLSAIKIIWTYRRVKPPWDEKEIPNASAGNEKVIGNEAYDAEKAMASDAFTEKDAGSMAWGSEKSMGSDTYTEKTVVDN